MPLKFSHQDFEGCCIDLVGYHFCVKMLYFSYNINPEILQKEK